MESVGGISKKKMIIYAVIIAVLLISVVILLIQRKIILNQQGASVGSNATGESTSAGNVGQTGLDKNLTTTIDTNLFNNKKYQALKKNILNISSEFEIGKRNPFAPTENK